MYLFPGDKVKGSISGRYLGTVIKAWKDDVILRGPDGAEITMSKSLLEVVPVRIGGISRVWVEG